MVSRKIISSTCNVRMLRDKIFFLVLHDYPASAKDQNTLTSIVDAMTRNDLHDLSNLRYSFSLDLKNKGLTGRDDDEMFCSSWNRSDFNN